MDARLLEEYGRIEGVAILDEDGKVWALSPPRRHHDLIRWLASSGRPTPIRGEQGFITSRGRFVRRKPALRLARAAGQVLRETAPAHGLFSEDVW